MLLFSACRKDSFKGTETGNAGKTYVWITEAPSSAQFFSPFTDVKAVTMFTVRRDAASSADLNKAVTIALTDISSTYLDAYNTANGTNYSPLTSDIYTLPTAADITTGGAFATAKGISATATGLSINFAGGDYDKNVIFKIDGSKVDLSKQYAVAYTITSFDGFSKKIGSDTILTTVAIKNKWDGVYEVTAGTMTDAANPGLTHINTWLAANGTASGYPDAFMRYELRTTSATQCVLYNNWITGLQGVNIPINSGGNLSYYGSFGLVLNFDPTTNAITSITNYYGQPAGNTRSAQLDPSGANAYDPTTQTIDIKYFMLQPSVIVAAPFVRTSWAETWKYVGSR